MLSVALLKQGTMKALAKGLQNAARPWTIMWLEGFSLVEDITFTMEFDAYYKVRRCEGEYECCNWGEWDWTNTEKWNIKYVFGSGSPDSGNSGVESITEVENLINRSIDILKESKLTADGMHAAAIKAIKEKENCK